jgi:hypothetical protein
VPNWWKLNVEILSDSPMRHLILGSAATIKEVTFFLTSEFPLYEKQINSVFSLTELHTEPIVTLACSLLNYPNDIKGHCATSQKVAVSIPDEIIGFFN